MQYRFMKYVLHVVWDQQNQNHLQNCQKGELFGSTPEVQNLKLWERHPVMCVPKSFQMPLMLQQFENHCSVPLHILLASGCLVVITSWGQPLLVGANKPAQLEPDSDFLMLLSCSSCLPSQGLLLYPKGTERVWGSSQCPDTGSLKVQGILSFPKDTYLDK